MECYNWQWTNAIPLLQTNTADTAHTGIFASNTRPLSRFLGGAWGRGYHQHSIFSTQQGDSACFTCSFLFCALGFKTFWSRPLNVPDTFADKKWLVVGCCSLNLPQFTQGKFLIQNILTNVVFFSNLRSVLISGVTVRLVLRTVVERPEYRSVLLI